LSLDTGWAKKNNKQRKKFFRNTYKNTLEEQKRCLKKSQQNKNCIPTLFLHVGLFHIMGL